MSEGSMLSDLKIVTEQLEFPEGPVVLSNGDVLVVEIKRGTLSRVTPDGEVFVEAYVGGGPNGAALGPHGDVFICNNGGFEWQEVDGITIPLHTPDSYEGGSIQRMNRATGEVNVLYTHCGDRPLYGPNDLVFDSTGGFYFSDYGKTYPEYRTHGYLYYARADGSEITCLIEGMLGPNGVGLSPDEAVLYCAETPTARLWAFDITNPGKLAPGPTVFQPGRLVASLPDYCMLDSLKVEASGAVCVGTLIKGGVTRFSPEGVHEFIRFPDISITNLCFGGADGCDVWATGSSTGRLYKGRWRQAGLRLNYAEIDQS
jgi:gluconolactonase